MKTEEEIFDEANNIMSEEMYQRYDKIKKLLIEADGDGILSFYTISLIVSLCSDMFEGYSKVYKEEEEEMHALMTNCLTCFSSIKEKLFMKMMAYKMDVIRKENTEGSK
jgi:hypothetical protein